ncbi:MAG TPA: hypothetical protein VH877_27055 [Polyangia bacterium]|jgi:hypothetical protein|nr:hypothetical protein [Polyangia bacterium]
MKRSWFWYFLVAQGLWMGLITAVALRRRFPPLELPPLPAYALVAEAEGLQIEGADPEGLALGQVAPDATLTLVARPARAVVGPVELRPFIGRDGRSWPWAVAFESLGAGVFLLRAPIRALPDLGPGAWELTFLVGRPQELTRRLPAEPAAPAGEQVQRLHVRLEVTRPAENEPGPVK